MDITGCHWVAVCLFIEPLIVSFQCDMHGLKSGSETGGGPSWSILIGSQGTLLCHFLTCMMGMLATRFTNSGPDSW